MTAHTDKPSDAQMAQALEWFHRRISSFIGLDDAQRDHCAAIEEALLNYQAPSVRTVSWDASAGTSEPVAWMWRDMEGHSFVDRVCLGGGPGHIPTEKLTPLYTHPPATSPSPELEQVRAALHSFVAPVRQTAVTSGCCGRPEPFQGFCRTNGQITNGPPAAPELRCDIRVNPTQRVHLETEIV